MVSAMHGFYIMSYITSGFWRHGLALSTEPNRTGFYLRMERELTMDNVQKINQKCSVQIVIKIQSKAQAYKFVECCNHKFFFHFMTCFGMLFLLLGNTREF
jgi:uncharacterized membrane protein